VFTHHGDAGADAGQHDRVIWRQVLPVDVLPRHLDVRERLLLRCGSWQDVWDLKRLSDHSGGRCCVSTAGLATKRHRPPQCAGTCTACAVPTCACM